MDDTPDTNHEISTYWQSNVDWRPFVSISAGRTDSGISPSIGSRYWDELIELHYGKCSQLL